ncbi:MAG: hypothetical protein ABIH46_08315, partial [Chloroflexota bacterium]
AVEKVDDMPLQTYDTLSSATAATLSVLMEDNKVSVSDKAFGYVCETLLGLIMVGYVLGRRDERRGVGGDSGEAGEGEAASPAGED